MGFGPEESRIESLYAEYLRRLAEEDLRFEDFARHHEPDRSALEELHEDQRALAGLSDWVSDEAQAPPLELVTLGPGDRVGPYEITDKLGSGGMGEVYAATDERGRPLALKRMKPGATDLQYERFEREARVAASVFHPRCVVPYRAERIDDTPFLAMELLPGPDLQERVERDGPLPKADAQQLALDLLEGLEILHADGFLHRDLKPANCIYGRDGRIKISDFGLSKGRRDPSLTAFGAAVGTPLWSAPEQLRGLGAAVESDLFSAAATIFFAYTGLSPRDVEGDGPPSARALRKGLPEALDAVLARGLAERPEARWASAAEFRAALRAALRQDEALQLLPRRAAARALDAVFATLLGLSIFLFSLPVLVGVASESIGSSEDLLTKLGRATANDAAVVLFLLLSRPLYYVWFERSGTTPGKALLNLRINRLNDTAPPGWLRAAGRFAVMSLAPIASTAWILWRDGYFSGSAAPLVEILSGSLALSAIGWVPYLAIGAWVLIDPRGPHGRLTGTFTGPVEDAPIRFDSSSEPQGLEGTRDRAAMRWELTSTLTIDHVLWYTPSGELWIGTDRRLQRPLWVHRTPVGVGRSLSASHDPHPTVLTRVDGGQTETFDWEAFLPPRGAPVRDALPRDWPSCRAALVRLVHSLRSSPVPCYSLGQVFVSSDGRFWVASPELMPDPGARENLLEEQLARCSRAALAHSYDERDTPAHALQAVRGLLEPGPTEAKLDAFARRLRQQPHRAAIFRPFRLLVTVLALFFGHYLLVQMVVEKHDAQARALVELARGAEGERAADWARALAAHLDRWSASYALLGKTRRLASHRSALDEVGSPAEASAPAPPSRAERLAAYRSALAPQTRPVGHVQTWTLGAFLPVLALLAFLLRGGVLTRATNLVVLNRHDRRAPRWQAAARTVVAWLPTAALFGTSVLTVWWFDRQLIGWTLFVLGIAASAFASWVTLTQVWRPRRPLLRAPERALDALTATRVVER